MIQYKCVVVFFLSPISWKQRNQFLRFLPSAKRQISPHVQTDKSLLRAKQTLAASVQTHDPQGPLLTHSFSTRRYAIQSDSR